MKNGMVISFIYSWRKNVTFIFFLSSSGAHSDYLNAKPCFSPKCAALVVEIILAPMAFRVIFCSLTTLLARMNFVNEVEHI